MKTFGFEVALATTAVTGRRVRAGFEATMPGAVLVLASLAAQPINDAGTQRKTTNLKIMARSLGLGQFKNHLPVAVKIGANFNAPPGGSITRQNFVEDAL